MVISTKENNCNKLETLVIDTAIGSFNSARLIRNKFIVIVMRGIMYILTAVA